MNPKTLALKMLALQDAGWQQNDEGRWQHGPYEYNPVDSHLWLAQGHFTEARTVDEIQAAIAAFEGAMALLRTHIALPLRIDHDAQYLFSATGNHLAQIDPEPWWGSVARIPAPLVPSALLLLASCALQELIEGRTPAAPFHDLLAAPLVLPLHYDSTCQMIRDGAGLDVLNIRGWGWMQNALGTQTAAAAFQDFLGQTWARAMTQAFAAQPAAGQQPAASGKGTASETAGHLDDDSLYPLLLTQEKGMTIHVPTMGGFGAGRIAALHALAFEHGITVVTSQPTLPMMQITNPYAGLKEMAMHMVETYGPVPDGKARRRERRKAARKF